LPTQRPAAADGDAAVGAVGPSGAEDFPQADANIASTSAPHRIRVIVICSDYSVSNTMGCLHWSGTLERR